MKSYRLGVSLIEKLDVAAKRAHMTESAFLTHMLEDRLAIDPLIPAFPEITMSAPTFSGILRTRDPIALEAVASEIATRNLKLAHELYATAGQGLTFEGYVRDVLAAHSHWFQIEGDGRSTRG